MPSSCNSASEWAAGHRRTHGPDERRSGCIAPRPAAFHASCRLAISHFLSRWADRSWASPCPTRILFWNRTAPCRSRCSGTARRHGCWRTCPLPGNSVPAWRVIWNCSGDNCFFHSASDFSTFSTSTTPFRTPEESNSTIFTSCFFQPCWTICDCSRAEWQSQQLQGMPRRSMAISLLLHISGNSARRLVNLGKSL